jgi:hypothetical protein
MLRRVALIRTDVPEGLSASLVFLRNVRRLLVKASVVPRLPILVTLMKEALSSSETRRKIPKDVILHSHRRENLKSCVGLGFLPVLRFPRPLIHSTNCFTIITIYHLRLVQYSGEWQR